MTRSTLEGSWKNQHGSMLRIEEVAGDGSIRGTFRPGVGLARGEVFPIIGVASEDIFSFTVGFGAHGITSWVGYFASSRAEELSATWIMVIGAADVHDPEWKRTLTGADVFRPSDAARSDRVGAASAPVPDVP